MKKLIGLILAIAMIQGANASHHPRRKSMGKEMKAARDAAHERKPKPRSSTAINGKEIKGPGRIHYGHGK